MKAFIIFLSLMGFVFASECKVESFNVHWTAYKTPAKIPISGTFGEVNLELRHNKSLCLYSFLPTTTVHIKTASIKTENTTMQETITAAFFKNMIEGDYINAIIKRIDAEAKELSVEITMNDVSQTIFMPFTYKDKVFKAKGKIDVLNFSASKALSTLNEACYESHKGKTWSEVELSFVMTFKEDCN